MLTLANRTPWAVDTLRHTFPPDQPALVVIVKSTWTWQATGRLEPAARQIPVFAHDVPWPDGATGTARFETDRVPFKPVADIVVVGDAHAPAGQPVRQLEAGIRVGDVRCRIRVHGDRRWRLAADGQPVIGPAAPFQRMPLRHERAFGGIDVGEVCAENPVGRGLVSAAGLAGCDGRPLPNLEDPSDPIVDWRSRPRPVATGCRARTAASRIAQAGRIDGHADEAWRRSPAGLPDGFGYGVFNAAMPALQVPGWLRGDEAVELHHLTPEGRTGFALPGLRPDVRAVVRSAPAVPAAPPAAPMRLDMRLDTLTIVAEHRTVLLVHRGAVRLTRLADDGDGEADDVRLLVTDRSTEPEPA